MTEAELIAVESAVERMKGELDIGEKCKKLVATVRHLQSKVDRPTVEQVKIAFDFMKHAEELDEPHPEPIKAAYAKAVAFIDRFLS